MIDVTEATPRADFELVVFGTPGPQGSKSAFPIYAGPPCPRCTRRALKMITLRESSQKVEPWRKAITWAVRNDLAALRRAGVPVPPLPLAGPLAATMVFTMASPKGHYGTGRNAGVRKPSAPPYPDGYPDLSKLARSTEDALTTSGVWADDARVVEYDRLAKVWPGCDPDALDKPGVLIRVRRLLPPPPESLFD